MKPILLAIGSLLAVFSGYSGGQVQPAPDAKPQVCYNLGDKIVVRGRIDPSLNDGTYLALREPLCIHSPQPTDQTITHSLTTLGNKLTPNRFLEVKGELRSMAALGEDGFAIVPTDVKDIDPEIRAIIDKARQACEKWQDSNTTALTKKAHGAKVVREPQDDQDDDFERGCMLKATDKSDPHEEFTLRKPAE